jgi:hypothetical protein
MKRITPPRHLDRTRVGVLVALGLLLAACGNGSAGSTSPSPSPTPAVTASAQPTAAPSGSASSPTASAAGSPAADPAVGLKIAAPYTLTTLDPNVEASVRQGFMASAGAFGGLIAFGGRAVETGGKSAGYVFVIGFPAGIMSEVTFQSVLAGLASSANLTFTTTTVAGKSLSTGSNAQVGYGVFQAGDAIDMVVTPPGAPAEPIARALIAANP